MLKQRAYDIIAELYYLDRQAVKSARRCAALGEHHCPQSIAVSGLDSERARAHVRQSARHRSVAVTLAYLACHPRADLHKIRVHIFRPNRRYHCLGSLSSDNRSNVTPLRVVALFSNFGTDTFPAVTANRCPHTTVGAAVQVGVTIVQRPAPG